MSDRTQGSVRTEDGSSDEDPQTAAIPSEEPAAGKPAAQPSAASGSKPATAPGWGGATPAGSRQAAPKQSGNPQPAQKQATPQQPAAKQAAPKQGAPKQAPTKQAPTKQPTGQAAPQQVPPAQPAPAGGARPASAPAGSRSANRDAAGAPRQPGSRPPAAVRPGEAPTRTTAAEGERSGERSGGRGVRAPGGGKGPRRARLQLRHVDTWSALKISLVLAIALFFVWMVAVGVLYGVLNGLGVFTTLNDLIGQLGSSASGSGGGEVITPGIVFGGAAVIGAVNIVLFTALCTVGTFVYNLCADLVGGLEVTLSERD
ncbi:DUF3566 domain-containing protein [Klenkia sp. LSe6-5]|uniref:DUF3566 domain-containing protein n=1 Tax=Klenkia sesuvii TaxID=3103137 RepID=A0ABU8DS29_9ACTN